MAEVTLIYTKIKAGDIVTFSDRVPPDAIRGNLVCGALTMFPPMRNAVCGKTFVVERVSDSGAFYIPDSIFVYPPYMVRKVNGMPFKHYWENYVANGLCREKDEDDTPVSVRPDLAALLGGDSDA